MRKLIICVKRMIMSFNYHIIRYFNIVFYCDLTGIIHECMLTQEHVISNIQLTACIV